MFFVRIDIGLYIKRGLCTEFGGLSDVVIDKIFSLLNNHKSVNPGSLVIVAHRFSPTKKIRN